MLVGAALEQESRELVPRRERGPRRLLVGCLLSDLRRRVLVDLVVAAAAEVDVGQTSRHAAHALLVPAIPMQPARPFESRDRVIITTRVVEGGSQLLLERGEVGLRAALAVCERLQVEVRCTGVRGALAGLVAGQHKVAGSLVVVVGVGEVVSEGFGWYSPLERERLAEAAVQQLAAAFREAVFDRFADQVVREAIVALLILGEQAGCGCRLERGEHLVLGAVADAAQ
ncbi:MAG TPA: hypothetical protein VFI30_07005 [Nocardioidaceae bacterium]|nr:hypothetical protein [Nocardioidaceae bacterium]